MVQQFTLINVNVNEPESTYDDGDINKFVFKSAI